MNLLQDERLDVINENLSLIQKKDGLTFGTDAYLLAAFAGSGSVFADLGAGTGVISLLCLEKKKARHVYAIEIQPEFASLCTRNAELNNLGERLTAVCSDVRDADISLTGQKEVDTVITNPPYMPRSSGKENESEAKNTARREIFGGIADFARAGARLLRTGGNMYVVYRPERMSELFCALHDAGVEPKELVTVYPNADASPSLILVKAKKGAAPGLKIYRPLITYGADGKYTSDFSEIYESCSLEHLKK